MASRIVPRASEIGKDEGPSNGNLVRDRCSRQPPTDPATLERAGRWRWAGGEKSKLPPLLTNGATGLSVQIRIGSRSG
jgi:hypothetical protein